MNKFLTFGVVLALAMGLQGCGSVAGSEEPDIDFSDESNTIEVEDVDSSEDASHFSEGDNTFQITPGHQGGFYRYMLDQSSGENAVFSSESLKSAFYLYSSLLNDEGKASLCKFVNNVDYLSYKSNDTFKTVNRLWLNSAMDMHPDAVGLSSDLVRSMDMSDSDAATAEKNKFVSDQTNGFINGTPTVFDSETILDAMNIVYFKDKWRGGDMQLASEPVPFHNADGTVNDVTMIDDYVNPFVFHTDNAHACTMTYADGFEFTVVLPDDANTSLYEIDMDAFVEHTAECDECNSVSLCIPEFETDSFYQLGFDVFGLNPGSYNPAFCNLDHAPSKISQVAKIKFDHTGTEAAAVSEVFDMTNAVSPRDLKSYRMVCDRPFAYFIRDTLNDDVVFFGVITSMS